VAAARRGEVGERREEAFDSFITDQCIVRGRRSRGTVATDGELIRIAGPVTYELQRDALKVVVPTPAPPE